MTLVPGHGPYDAPLLVVGEAAGPHEVAHRRPFSNPAGAGGMMRRGLAKAGLEDVERLVRWTNVVGHNPGRLTEPIKKRLLEEHWEHIDTDLLRMSPRVILAVGGLALARLTGRTNISDEHGGVWPTRDLPKQVHVGGVWRPTRLPDGALVIACLHPAGVMQTKIQAERVQIEAVLARTAEYALGRAWDPWLPTPVVGPNAHRLAAVLGRSTAIVVDTEFPIDGGPPYLVGVLGDAAPDDVFIWNPSDASASELNGILQAQFNRHDAVKVAHYTPADIGSLGRVGITPGPTAWFDTLYAYATLYPDTSVGLNHAALHFCDDASNWKAMANDDPGYLALDVHRTYRVFLGASEELRAGGLLGVWQDEVISTPMLLDEMEVVGFRVDEGKQRELLGLNQARRESLAEEIKELVGDRFAGATVKRSVKELEQVLTATDPTYPLDPCKVHPAYKGVRRKRFSSDERCSCSTVYASFPVERAPLRPFEPGNNHDLRWLLYEGLKLPVRKNPETGKPTANTDAVNYLCDRLAISQDKRTSKYRREDWQEIVRLLASIKEFQHLEKMASTFLTPPMDAAGFAHPPHRGWGTGTGRPAGGFDSDLGADGASGAYSFNPFNIPRPPDRSREIFIPSHDGWRFVYADWAALESWLTAFHSRDQTLAGELEGMLTGGHKPHALNAALIYGIDPGDAKRHEVILKGQPSTAYDGGKRMTHLWSYGGEAGMIAQTFWLESAFAQEVYEKLGAKYRRIVEWREELEREVFGEGRYVCSHACGGVFHGVLPRGASCSCGGAWRWDGFAVQPARELRTAFGRRRLYPGRRRDARKAVASQKPQGGGGSMFYRTLHRLSGFEVVDGVRRPWPSPTFPYRVVSGTYDSFLLETSSAHADELLAFLIWTMEQPWRQLGGLRVPCEGAIGLNYGVASSVNTSGLTDVSTVPFKTVWKAA